MYRAMGLLRSGSDFTLEAVQTRLATKLPAASVERDGDRVLVRRGEWWIAVAVVCGPYVLTETEGLLGNLAGIEPDEARDLATSDRRVEVWTDVPDPFMEHFNDYLYVIEVLKSFTGLVAVDPKEPCLL